MIGYGEDIDTLLPVVLKVGEINLKCMALLDKANTATYGNPEPTTVSLKVEKGPCILLTLLHLGIKNIKLGPSLPAFVSPNILKYLVDNYGIAPITTPEEDLAELLKK